MSFISLGLSQSLLTALERENITTPYPIQTQAIPAILENRDILGIAKTGSGKTLSYVLPILMDLQKGKVLKNRHIQVLVVVPTRELAAQVNSVFIKFINQASLDLKTLAAFGGASI